MSYCDSSLNFPNTCPKIDGVIKEIRNILRTNLDNDIFDENFVDRTFSAIEAEVEELRNLNSDMRDHANTQLKEFYDNYDELEYKVNSLEDNLDDSNKEIEHLNKEILNYQDEIEHLRNENETLKIKISLMENRHGHII